MKKYNPLLAFLLLIFFLITGFSQLQAGPIDDYLARVEREFDSTRPSRRYAIVSVPLDRNYLCSLKNLRELDNRELTAKVGNYDKTNSIALAISRGKPHLVRKFLSAIENVNEEGLTAWGYRQPYTLAHMALDPRFPLSQNVRLKDRLEIIDTLAERGADFNAIIWTDHYNNPPLAAGDPSGHPLNIYHHLRARALLYGADPKVKGSSFQGLTYGGKLDLPSQLTLDYYIERTKAGTKLTPTANVMGYLREYALKERGFDLDKLVEGMTETRSKQLIYKNRIRSYDFQINALRLQKTKKTKRKIAHLQMLTDELRSRINTLNRKLNRFGKD